MDKEYITITEASKKRYQYNEIKHAYETWGQFGKLGFGAKHCFWNKPQKAGGMP